MNESVEFTVINEQNYLPQLLKDVFNGNFPDYLSTPDIIDIQNTGIDQLLNDFRTISTQKLIELIKRKTTLSENGHLSANDRKSRGIFWRTEFGQRLFDNRDTILLSSVTEGDIGRVTFRFNPNQELRMSIHSHPSCLALSELDILTVLNKRKMIIQIASTDDGYFLAFPTKESRAPEGEEFEYDFWQLNRNEILEIKLIKKERTRLLNQLIAQYGRNILSSFFGEKIIERKTDPNEINEKGVALIQLYHLLILSEKYKICVYFMDKNESTFKRITKLEDIFPELAM